MMTEAEEGTGSTWKAGEQHARDEEVCSTTVMEDLVVEKPNFLETLLDEGEGGVVWRKGKMDPEKRRYARDNNATKSCFKDLKRELVSIAGDVLLTCGATTPVEEVEQMAKLNSFKERKSSLETSVRRLNVGKTEFLKVLNDPERCKSLQKFMTKQLNAENLHFWKEASAFYHTFHQPNLSPLGYPSASAFASSSSTTSTFPPEPVPAIFGDRDDETERLRSLHDAQLLISAKLLYERYCKPGAEMEINVDAEVQLKLTNALASGQPTGDMFEEARSAIFLLMLQDVFPRFLRSHVEDDENAGPS
ncbi:regulator of G-protein signaling [Balamuthia mandrillaris]